MIALNTDIFAFHLQWAAIGTCLSDDVSHSWPFSLANLATRAECTVQLYYFVKCGHFGKVEMNLVRRND